MKRIIRYLIVLAVGVSALRAQQPISRDVMLAQLYDQYDPVHQTAHWNCPPEQKPEGLHEGWPCWKEYSTVAVDVLMTVGVDEDGTQMFYLIAAANPVAPKDEITCHACAPAIGAAVFAFEDGRWVLRNANPAIGFYGSWGSPPRISFVSMGPDRHAFVLRHWDEGQGYSSSLVFLLMPVGKTISEVWSIGDEHDDAGAYDPEDRSSGVVPYRSSAAFKFIAPEDFEGEPYDYFDIEVISRGRDEDKRGRIVPENWTEIYRLSNGKYRILRREKFTETPNRKGTKSSQKRERTVPQRLKP